jgi:hypothetical protein
MFLSPSPGHGWPTPHHRLVVRPDELIEVAHRFSLSARVMRTSSRRLRVAASAVRLNAADPGLADFGVAHPGVADPGLADSGHAPARVADPGLADSGLAPARVAGIGRGVDSAVEAFQGLWAEGRWLEQLATELAATAAAASEADGGRWSGPVLPAVDQVRSATFGPGGPIPGPGTIDRVAGELSVAGARILLARLEMVYDGWDVRHGRWTGVARAPRSSRPPAASDRAYRRRTIGWLGPGRSADPSGDRTSPPRAQRTRGVRAVAQALDLTAAEHWIRADEIGLIEHGHGVYTVVLPGVTDLSRPSSGWNPDHRSVRDLDMAALDSARSSATADNRYAGAVAKALDRAGVEPGARLTVVGHSYGADTALDLAADRRFNGLVYRVEHVVAAGYYSQPQLGHLPPSTDVLVLQNRRDVVIEAERLARWIVAPMESLAATVIGTAATGSGTRSGVTVIGFDGGRRGAGHHPHNYRRFVQRLGSRSSSAGPGAGSTGSMEDVDRFLTGVGAGPWGGGGRLDAVNVSVPT